MQGHMGDRAVGNMREPQAPCNMHARKTRAAWTFVTHKRQVATVKADVLLHCVVLQHQHHQRACMHAPAHMHTQKGHTTHHSKNEDEVQDVRHAQHEGACNQAEARLEAGLDQQADLPSTGTCWTCTRVSLSTNKSTQH